MTVSQGTFQTTQLAMAAGDGRVFSLDRNQATRNGKSLNTTGTNVFELRDGLVQSVQQYFEDTTENDAFWS
jgi:ketosteroid isomerase-like protein